MMYGLCMDLPTTTEIITIKDSRKATRQAKNHLVFSAEALDIALAVTGVDLCTGETILVELRDGEGGKQGFARRTAKGFKVVLYVAKKNHYEDRHHYVINNSLCHELRHVAQMQAHPNFTAAYNEATLAYGYHANPYEVEARYFGRLADHTGTKDCGPAGMPALGELVWAVRFA